MSSEIDDVCSIPEEAYYIPEEESSTFVHLVGDSTIDNLGWVAKDPKDRNSLERAKPISVEGKLRTRLGNLATVYNVAYDGFTTESVLNGDTVGRIFASEFPHIFGDASAYADVRVDGGSTEVKPLEQIREKIENHQDATHWVVISVMGNDFREKLGGNPVSLLKEIPAAQQRYLEIARRVKEMGGRPIFMYQYRTDRNNNEPYGIYREFDIIGKVAAGLYLLSAAALGVGIVSSIARAAISLWSVVGGVVGAAFLYGLHQLVPIWVVDDLFRGRNMGIALYGRLMEKLYHPINEEAIREGIPILDLPNTFNPYLPLYTCEIEPNEAGSDLIAKGIEAIVRAHDETMGSHRYFKPFDEEEYTHRETLLDWRVQYPPQPIAV